METKNIIYYLCGVGIYCNKLQKQGCKIGSTISIISRMKTYQTGYSDKVPLICYYKINRNCYEIDNEIQVSFNNHRLNTMGSEGGTEIYDSAVITTKKLEEFLIDKGIEFEKYYPTDLDYEDYKKQLTKEDMNKLIKDYDNKYKNNYKTCWDQLYFWQKEALDECKEFFESKDKAGLIIAPTGAGKSYFMNYISICHYIYNTNNDVIIMTKRKEILDNAFIKEGKKFIKQLNLNCEFINLINIDDKDIDSKIFSNNKNSRIYIINIDKFISSNKFSSYTDYNFGKVKLLLFDECHWCGADKIFNFINYMKHNVVDKIIGFSATPIRQEEKNKENSLELFKNLENEYNVIYTRSYLDSIYDGDRVKTNWIIIKTNSKNLQKEEQLEEQIENLENKIIGRCLNKTGFKDFTNKLNDFLIKNNSICGKGILWFPNIKNLVEYNIFINENKKDYSKIVNTTFFPTYSKSKDYPEDTYSNLNNFKEKKENAILLAVCRATEGFDDKPIDFGFNVYTVKNSNPLLDQQKEGRVSRKYEENNKKKLCGYFGFLVNKDYDKDEENNNIAKRLADWIDYMKQFECISSNTDKKDKPSKEKTLQEYLDVIIDSKNFEKIEFDIIKKKIFEIVELENEITTPRIIKRIIQKENKKRLNNNTELIDTKEKYDEYAEEWGLAKSSQITYVDNNNWVKLLRPDFDEFIKQFYTWDELETYFKENQISSIEELQKINNNKKIPNYLLILAGMYNENKNEKALADILYKKKVLSIF